MIVREQQYSDVDRDGKPRDWLQISVELGDRCFGAKHTLTPKFTYRRARDRINGCIIRRLRRESGCEAAITAVRT